MQISACMLARCKRSYFVEEPRLISLFRMIYRSVFTNGKPWHQVLIGLLLMPVGAIVSWEALYGDPTGYYPYFVLMGIVFAIFGLVILIKGVIGLTTSKPAHPQTAINAQYPQPTYVPPRYPEQ